MLVFYLSLIEEQSDKELFTEIYENNISKMFNIAKGILHSDELANESVHEAFLKLIKHFSKFTALGSEHQKGWIALTTKYTSLNILKKENKYVAVENSYLFDIIEKQQENEPTHIYEDLVEEINNLPEKYKSVLELYYTKGYSNKEIAIMLNISVDNAMQRLSRARKMLLEKIENNKNNQD